MGENYLLVDCCNNGSGFVLNLNESASTDKGLVRFRGKFQEAESINKNKRLYPYSVLDESVKKLKEAVKNRGLIGELDHPCDSIIHFEKASHIITKLWWEGNSLMGEGEILGTPHGKILKTLIENGVRVGISSRGVGNGKVNEDGILVIGESYKLITFDAVADPSTFAAFQEKISNKSEGVKPMPQNSHEHSIKNEGTSINKISKDALIACLGGVIKTQTSNIKERLG